MRKTKPRPQKTHLLNPVVTPIKQQEEARGFPAGKVQSWVIGARDVDETEEVYRRTHDGRSVVENATFETEEDDKNETEDDEDLESNNGVVSLRKGRGFISDMWGMGEKALDALADQVIENENAENGVQEKSSFEG